MKLNDAGWFVLNKPVEFNDNGSAKVFAAEKIQKKKGDEWETVRYDNYIMTFWGDAADKAGFLNYDAEKRRGDSFFIKAGRIEVPYTKEDGKSIVYVNVTDIQTYDEFKNA